MPGFRGCQSLVTVLINLKIFLIDNLLLVCFLWCGHFSEHIITFDFYRFQFQLSCILYMSLLSYAMITKWISVLSCVPFITFFLYRTVCFWPLSGLKILCGSENFSSNNVVMFLKNNFSILDIILAVWKKKMAAAVFIVLFFFHDLSNAVHGSRSLLIKWKVICSTTLWW